MRLCQLPAWKVISSQWFPCAPEREGAEANSCSPQRCEGRARCSTNIQVQEVASVATVQRFALTSYVSQAVYLDLIQPPRLPIFNLLPKQSPSPLLTCHLLISWILIHSPSGAWSWAVHSLPVRCSPYFQSWMFLPKGITGIVESSLWW